MKNVTLYGFLDEKDLLALMQKCQVSLSILHDTVGSNVITTSMACGLVNVVSDVGSMRDYCDESCAILCDTQEDFIKALDQLSKNKNNLVEKSIEARNRALEFSLTKSIFVIFSIIEK